MVAKPQPRESRPDSKTKTVIRQTTKVVAKPPISPPLTPQAKSTAKPVFRQPEKTVKATPRPRPKTRHEAVEAKKTYRLIIKEPYIE